jgi:hypothetical protein
MVSKRRGPHWNPPLKPIENAGTVLLVQIICSSSILAKYPFLV